ncbi:MAG: hypothetical protein COA93_05710 [Alphaproteobacteria bacterium]|nr:MAG: hypothetical protein COA93_05710 [Alphaproteobacteria bacterium]
MESKQVISQARCAGRCGSSVKQRNDADDLFWPTEGRVLLSYGYVELFIRCLASHCKARLAIKQNHPGQMAVYKRRVL